MKVNKVILYCCICMVLHTAVKAQVWQWSATIPSIISEETKDHPVAFLWVPENCKYVRGVVLGQHNMLEEGIFEHPDFRRAMSYLGFAIVWVTPNFSITFDFNKGAGAQFQQMMDSLASVSGYNELKFAPIVPIGHSALASYPWNFAAWNPGRTLAVLSVHGDAPQTKLTGSGRPNPDWGGRTIEVVPGLMVMGEYEWWEKRITPGFDYVAKHPGVPITFFCDAGRGHFDYSDQLISYISLYLKKAVQYRLPDNEGNDTVILKPVDPKKGWLMDRWRPDSLPVATAAPYLYYQGDFYTSSWCFDRELADATEAVYQNSRGKKQQYIGFIQKDTFVAPQKTHGNYQLQFSPLPDGISFYVKAAFTDSSRIATAKQHANSGVSVSRICGPVQKLDDTTFQLRFYRMGFNNPKRSNDIWFIASNNGDKTYKSVVQQAGMRFPLENKEGREQQIHFPEIKNQKAGIVSLKLQAVSSIGLPVYYYVKQGPAIVKGNKLLFTAIPPRSRFPLKLTVVAWQYGNAAGGKIRSAQPVERSFYLTNKR